MFIPISKIISLLPLVILMTGIVIIMFSMIFKRNHLFVFFTTFFSLLCTFCSLLAVYLITPISVTILLYINFYSVLYIFIIIISSIFLLCISYFYLKNFCIHQEEFYVLLLSSIIGSIILIESNHIISILLGMELMYLPIFGLMTYFVEQGRTVRVILKYMLLSSMITVFTLLGIAFIYLITGSLNLNYIKIMCLVNSIVLNKILFIGLALLLISLFFKLSLFPLHFWISDVYENISPILLLYFTTVIKVASFSVLVKILEYCPYEQCKILYFIIEIVSCLSIFLGSVMVVSQDNIKKLFGYASIVHMGYTITTLFIIKNYHLANNIALIYLFHYTLSSIGIFGILSLLILLNNRIDWNINTISLYNILLKNRPILNISFFIIIFSFLGIPLTFGFVSKFFILLIVIHQKLWLILCAIVINSGFSIYYYLKVILSLYNHSNHSEIYYNQSYKVIEFLIVCASIIIILFGIFPQIVINFIRILY